MKAITRSTYPVLVAGLVMGGLAADSYAQLGSGWAPYTPSVRIHLDGETGDPTTFAWKAYESNCSPTICADYRYDSATDTEIFRILDNRSNRSEIRVYNDYSTGRRQFQGFVTFSAPLNDESLMQIWGSTTGATQLMLRGYADSGGSIRGGGATITGIYGVETRVNVIHNQGERVRIYFNGSKRGEFVDDEVVSNYHKYGCYGTLRTGAATVRWRQVRHYRDGNPPGTTNPTPTPTPTPTPRPGGAYVEVTPPGTAVTASTHDGNLPANTVDGSLATRWSASGDGQWLQLDLGTARTVAYVKVAVYNGNTRRNSFELQVSTGGGTWQTVWAGQSSGSTTAEETYDFADVPARWVRYLGHMNSVNAFNSVTEVSVFAVP